jgi:hypothetical protein
MATKGKNRALKRRSIRSALKHNLDTTIGKMAGRLGGRYGYGSGSSRSELNDTRSDKDE